MCDTPCPECAEKDGLIDSLITTLAPGRLSENAVRITYGLPLAGVTR